MPLTSGLAHNCGFVAVVALLRRPRNDDCPRNGGRFLFKIELGCRELRARLVKSYPSATSVPSMPLNASHALQYLKQPPDGLRHLMGAAGDFRQGWGAMLR